MNMRIIIFLAMLMIGLAGAIEDLSGTDPPTFGSPKMAKDHVGGDGPDLTTSQTAFLKDGNETNASIPGMKAALVGSMVRYSVPEVKYLTPAELQNRTVG